MTRRALRPQVTVRPGEHPSESLPGACRNARGIPRRAFPGPARNARGIPRRAFPGAYSQCSWHPSESLPGVPTRNARGIPRRAFPGACSQCSRHPSESLTSVRLTRGKYRLRITQHRQGVADVDLPQRGSKWPAARASSNTALITCGNSDCLPRHRSLQPPIDCRYTPRAAYGRTA